MSSYLQQIAQRTGSPAKRENTVLAPLSPISTIPSGLDTEDIFIAAAPEQPTMETNKRGLPADPVKRNVEPSLQKILPAPRQQGGEKKSPVSPVEYLERQVQRAVPMPVPPPAPPTQVEKTEKRSGPPPQENSTGWSDTAKERVEKEIWTDRLVLPNQPEAAPSTGKKEETTDHNLPRQDLGRTAGTAANTPPAHQSILHKTVTLVVPAENSLAQPERPRKSEGPKLSIDKITVEVISPSPKVQTEQRIVYRTVAPALPRAGNKSTSKLIFGLGQM